MKLEISKWCIAAIKGRRKANFNMVTRLEDPEEIY
jgi:hypothetical protein